MDLKDQLFPTSVSGDGDPDPKGNTELGVKEPEPSGARVPDPKGITELYTEIQSPTVLEIWNPKASQGWVMDAKVWLERRKLGKFECPHIIYFFQKNQSSPCHYSEQC